LCKRVAMPSRIRTPSAQKPRGWGYLLNNLFRLFVDSSLVAGRLFPTLRKKPIKEN
jgi:hypothetical protein